MAWGAELKTVQTMARITGKMLAMMIAGDFIIKTQTQHVISYVRCPDKLQHEVEEERVINSILIASLITL